MRNELEIIARYNSKKRKNRIFALAVALLFVLSIPVIEWKAEHNENVIEGTVTAKNMFCFGDSIITVNQNGNEVQLAKSTR